MANYTTAADIIDDALFRAHEPTDGTSDLDAAALSYLNRAYRSMCLGGAELVPGMNEDWWWLRSESTMILEPGLATGTVNVSHNSNAVVFSGILTMSSYIGWFFKVDDHPDVFKVAAGSSSDDGTLDSVYTGDTDTTASYKLFRLEYDLATDARKLVSPMRSSQAPNYMIYQTTLDRMNQDTPLGQLSADMPSHFAPVDENTVRFNNYIGTTSGSRVRLDYSYVRLATDLTNATDSIPLVPVSHRQILADWTTYFLMLDKDEVGADAIAGQARAGMIAMQKENRSRWVQTGRHGQIWPRPASRRRGLVKTDSGVIIG